ncbi:hypothetical protein M472_19220 [Sphingobacterium paucimobilis HER1398]|uniref:NadR/Ttd14 AAA domain-containing protein n=2 Tax=Sphingobacterium TaxID=28453 RepID=U2J7I4_9SPHI|nr:hypothetical protein M472_19220 [Sphingobacterium paucimobilis HER1398]
MREILPMLYPGKALRQCNYAELITLGMRRFEDRIHSEAQLPNGFISDGCPLQEWLYGSTRLVTGAYPDEYPWKMMLKKLGYYRSYRDFKKLLQGFEGMVKAYTRSHYDLFFHLPTEFPFVADGHRPTSERFRTESEKRLLATYMEMGIQPIVLSGSIEERLSKALQILDITPQHPIAYYIDHSTQERRERFDQVHLET